MSKKKVGRPSKIDRETMKSFNVSFIIIIVVLLILLSFSVMTIVSPELINNLKASIINLFK